jgi:hypothetical protein
MLVGGQTAIPLRSYGKNDGKTNGDTDTGHVHLTQNQVTPVRHAEIDWTP